MKKLILFFIAVLFAVNVSAERGNMVLGGSIGFDSRSGSEPMPNFTQLSIAPNFQYFLTDKFSLGVQVQFWTAKREDLDRTNSVNISVFGRYYLLKTQRFGVFGQARAGTGFNNNELQGFGSPSVNVRIAPGIQYFINSRWSVETFLFTLFDFHHQRFDAGTRNTFRAGVNNGMSSFAVNFHF